MKWTSEDIQFVEKAIEIKNKGYYLDGGQLTEVYNRVLENRATPTNCGSCIRQRVTELEAALNQFKKLNEKVEETKEEDTASLDHSMGLNGNNVDVLDAGATNVDTKSEQDAINERMAKVRAAKKVKK